MCYDVCLYNNQQLKIKFIGLSIKMCSDKFLSIHISDLSFRFQGDTIVITISQITHKTFSK